MQQEKRAAAGKIEGAARRFIMKPVVREIVAKTVLNRSTLGDYSLNCYVGCTHACAYCYARFMQRFHPHAEPWGAFVDVKVNAPEALLKQLRRAEPGGVFVSSACDAYQPLERERRLTRACAELLMRYGFEVHLLTKSALALDDIPMYKAGHKARIGVTIATPDEAAARVWEPFASPVAKRVEVLRAAKEAGLATSVMFGPLLPGISDDEESLDRLMKIAADLDVDLIWTDALNRRPKVWQSVAALLAKRYPALLEPYRKILFNEAARESYLEGLRRRIKVAAAHHRLTKRLGGCP
jgi:DNA repair photolyase